MVKNNRSIKKSRNSKKLNKFGKSKSKKPDIPEALLSICKDKRVTLSRKVCNGNKNHLEYKTVEELQKECLNKPMPKKRKSSIKKSTNFQNS